MVFAAEILTPDKIILATIALAFLALQVLQHVLKNRKEQNDANRADEMMRLMADETARVRGEVETLKRLLMKEHPAKDRLRIYCPLTCEDDLKECRKLLEQIVDTSGVYTTDPHRRITSNRGVPYYPLQGDDD